MLFHLLLFWFWQLSLTVWFSCVTFVSCVTGNSFGKLTPFVTELPISDARLYFHSTLCQPFKSVSCSHRLPAPRSKWRRSHLHVFSFCRETVKLWIEKGASWFAAHQLFLGLQLLISFQQKKKKKIEKTDRSLLDLQNKQTQKQQLFCLRTFLWSNTFSHPRTAAAIFLYFSPRRSFYSATLEMTGSCW